MKIKLNYINLKPAFSTRHVLKPETPKRNQRNETTKKNETTEKNETTKKNETTETVNNTS